MNSKSILTIILLMFFCSVTKGQITFEPSNNGTNFHLITPAIPNPMMINSRSISFTRVFLETGNGAFLQFSTENNQQQEFTKPWYFINSISRQPVVHLNTYYDTTRRPPHLSSFRFTTPTDNTGTNFQTLLTGNQFIKITPSVLIASPDSGTIIPGDTMALAITYKNIPSSELYTNDRTVIAFFYNDDNNTNVFSPINNATQYNFNGTMVNAIRLHNGESVVSPNTIPQQIRTQLDVYKGNLTQALYISAPYSGGNERNLFFTLAPNSNPADYQRLATTVKAVLVDYKLNNLSKRLIDHAEQPFRVSFLSRDPNYITTSPFCFKDISSATNRNVDYNVQFENIGAGNAEKIVIEVTIPKGIQFPTTGTRLFECSIGDIPVSMTTGIVGVSFGKKERSCRYDLYPESRKIKFTISNADLKGSVEMSGINHKGQIKFKLKTSLSRNTIRQCMYSTVSIKFDSNEVLKDICLTRVGCGLTTPCPPEFIDVWTGK